MVVTAQMKHAVRRKKCKFPPLTVPIFRRLLRYFIDGNHNITQQQFPAVRVETVRFRFLGNHKIAFPFKIQIGKRQHIRFLINITVFPVVFPNVFIIRQKQIDACFIGTILRL